jgi:RNA polymerase-binding transcription factor DksA
VPRLTDIEQALKVTMHEFGICDTCDVGLDCQDDFTSSVTGDSLKRRCNACQSKFEIDEDANAPFFPCYDQLNY